MRGFRFQSSFFLLVILAACASRESGSLAERDELEVETSEIIAGAEFDASFNEVQTDEAGIPSKRPLVLRSRIPLEMNAEVMKWIRYFAKKERDRFESYLVRGNQYKDLIQEILRKNELPEELYYLALIESGFVHHATSTANAVGYWQFVRPTGLQYGLRISPYVDERQDIVRATQAAAKYLKTLHKRFGDWHLAMAAYNAGQGRVSRAIRRSGITNYWELSRKGWIPRETRNYVPQFMAALIIGSFPERFNFEIPEPQGIPNILPVRVPSPVLLTDLAKVSDVPVKTIKQLNRHLKAGYTPPGISKYYVWMPADLKLSAAELNAKLLPYKKDSRLFAGGAAMRTHVVRRGETLSTIGRRYRKSVGQLRNQNNLRTNRIYVGQQLKIPGSERIAGKKARPRFYRVKRGDSLAAIARKYGVSVASLKSLNKIRGSTIYSGQSLKIASK